jgi:hypothetical protein
VKAGPQFEVLAENALGDYCLSSPAISDGQIFIRTAQNLYCIGKRAKQEPAAPAKGSPRPAAKTNKPTN